MLQTAIRCAIACTALSLLLTSLATAEPSWWQPNRQLAMAHDFGPALELVKFDPRVPQKVFATHPPVYDDLTATFSLPQLAEQIPQRQFSAGELRLLDTWVLPNHNRIGVVELRGKLASYYLQYGELPQTGADLFPELRTSIGSFLMREGKPEDLINKYALGINPITRHFFTTFNAAQWMLGGAFVEILSPEEAAKVLGTNHTLPALPNSGLWKLVSPSGGLEGLEQSHYDTPPGSMPNLWMHIKVWGEQQGTVVYENYNRI